MILLHKHHFGVAEYHRQVAPHQARDRISQGLVIPVELIFEEWLSSEPQAAEAFLDPGADTSMLSLRWAHARAAEANTPFLKPKSTATGAILEEVGLKIGGIRLSLGDPSQPPLLADQDERMLSFPAMPGYEDLLLGRDFITQHELMVVIDGKEESLSLLAPLDAENRQVRERILETLGEPRDVTKSTACDR
jgi:hypothetical protein